MLLRPVSHSLKNIKNLTCIPHIPYLGIQRFLTRDTIIMTHQHPYSFFSFISPHVQRSPLNHRSRRKSPRITTHLSYHHRLHQCKNLPTTIHCRKRYRIIVLCPLIHLLHLRCLEDIPMRVVVHEISPLFGVYRICYSGILWHVASSEIKWFLSPVPNNPTFPDIFRILPYQFPQPQTKIIAPSVGVRKQAYM